ncbi:LLM class flavin-dependent oxidoreductase [Lentibacillus sp. N15]|uniref:LLM class flavin-dependent oxidoreductase n=1 Tax=Lentibacillus songyuanensis TaxID=3136161 RepID=UPI0031BB7DFA
MKLSILDQAPIPAGKTAQETLQDSIRLAQVGDRLGYTRYWIAEHHDLTGLACPVPDMMIGIIASQTKNIRIGAGAVLLPHYKPFRVAEIYNMLATLYPDRIDLGIGRAPGGSAEVTMALSDNFLEQVRKVPEKIDDLLRFLHHGFPKDHMYAKIKPTPVPSIAPETWMLGTSGKSAVLAAEKGMAYTFGHFMSDADGPAIVENYQRLMAEKHPEQPASVIVTITVVCAETTEKAEQLAMSSLLWNVLRAKGEGEEGVPTVDEALSYPFSEEEQEMVRKAKEKMVIGNPQEVEEQLRILQQAYQVDELMIVTIVHDHEARIKSYEWIANELLR